MTFANFRGLQKAGWMRSGRFLRVLRAAGRIDGTAGNAPAVASQSTEGNPSTIKGWQQTRGFLQTTHQCTSEHVGGGIVPCPRT